MSRLQTERGEALPVGIEYSLRISSGRTLDTRQRSRRYLSNKSIIQQLANVCVKDRKKKEVKGCASKRLVWAGWLTAYGHGVNLFSQAPTPQIEGERGIIESDCQRNPHIVHIIYYVGKS
jgi:hypothetical protein